ncbi:MAG: bifunctional 4-hydroxy-2-oxoglutarate aldolase/2-dehydro-3-deoxy-phosphogluconate aldolase [Thermotaleaceae bacterium]
MNDSISMIKKHKIVSIIRTDKDYEILPVVESLYKGGIRIVEVTLNTPNALESIKEIRKQFPDMLVGAGTVLNTSDVEAAIASGANFLLAPTLDKDSILLANEEDVLIVPGVFTPTEAWQAYNYGAKIIKLFPVATLGSSYISDIHGPLPQLEIMAVGGINLDNAKEFLEKGSCSLGIGGSLVNNKDIAKKDFLSIEEKAKDFVEIAKQFKQDQKSN